MINLKPVLDESGKESGGAQFTRPNGFTGNATGDTSTLGFTRPGAKFKGSPGSFSLHQKGQFGNPGEDLTDRVNSFHSQLPKVKPAGSNPAKSTAPAAQQDSEAEEAPADDDGDSIGGVRGSSMFSGSAVQ